jgi:YbgC/YbaW family acyl-CoA thioester hydrolase
MYLDTAVADYWRALALPYESAMQHLGGDLYVKKASLEYHGSARFDDRLLVGIKCSRIGNSSMVFTGAIFRGEELLVSSELIYVFADPVKQTAKPVPDELRRMLTGFEAGEAVFSIQLGSWAELGTDASALRSEIFVAEQGIPMALVWDEADKTALHAVAYNGMGQAVATGRLLQLTPGIGKIGRMAVSRVLRGSGLGRELLAGLMAAARQRGDSQVLLHAQRSAQGFYSQLNFETRGDYFNEVDIPHIEMFKNI